MQAFLEKSFFEGRFLGWDLFGFCGWGAGCVGREAPAYVGLEAKLRLCRMPESIPALIESQPK
jgi:hypothetical protein